MESKWPRVIIADDHRIVCTGLQSLFSVENGFQTVSLACNGMEVINFLKKETADLVIMDINMPLLDGIEATKIIKKDYPEVKVLILSMHDKEGYIKNAIQAGADGYILKNAEGEELLNAAMQIMEGGTYFSQEVTATLIKRMRLYGESEGIVLSEKEKAILRLISDGFTSVQIAEKLFVSRHTIETYRKNLLLKFEAKNVSELVKIAVTEGFV